MNEYNKKLRANFRVTELLMANDGCVRKSWPVGNIFVMRDRQYWIY